VLPHRSSPSPRSAWPAPSSIGSASRPGRRPVCRDSIPTCRSAPSSRPPSGSDRSVAPEGGRCASLGGEVACRNPRKMSPPRAPVTLTHRGQRLPRVWAGRAYSSAFSASISNSAHYLRWQAQDNRRDRGPSHHRRHPYPSALAKTGEGPCLPSLRAPPRSPARAPPLFQGLEAPRQTGSRRLNRHRRLLTPRPHFIRFDRRFDH
jgi:hypothetical protein